ncbi:MAG: BON domain-containing protein [Bdellovibrionota bacterium]
MNSKYTFALLIVVALFQQACVLAAGAAGAEAGYVGTQKDRTAGETINDQALVAAVKTKLLAEKGVPSRRINVDSHKGKITLSGSVFNSAQVSKAIEIARETEGVKEVQSLLTVKPEN